MRPLQEGEFRDPKHPEIIMSDLVYRKNPSWQEASYIAQAKEGNENNNVTYNTWPYRKQFPHVHIQIYDDVDLPYWDYVINRRGSTLTVKKCLEMCEDIFTAQAHGQWLEAAIPGMPAIKVQARSLFTEVYKEIFMLYEKACSSASTFQLEIHELQLKMFTARGYKILDTKKIIGTSSLLATIGFYDKPI